MKKFLKVLALVLVVAMMSVAFVACGDGKEPDPQPQPGPGSTDTPASVIDTNITDAALKNVVGEGNLYVTAIGQSATTTVKNLLKRANWYVAEEAEGAGAKIYTINNKLEASALQAGDTVIVILGTSGKGLGSAGVSQADELARAQAIVAKAGVKVIAVHTGGKAYRGDSSDPIIEAVVPHAVVALVVDSGDAESGNYDGLFTTLCGTQVPLYTFSKSANMVASITHLVNA